MPHAAVGFTRRVLLVEDEQLTRALLETLIAQSGFEVRSCGNAETASEIAETFDPDAMVVDISLGDGPTGLDLIAAMQASRPHLAFVVLSNYAATPTHFKILSKVAYLRKRDVSRPEVLIDALNGVLTDQDPAKTFPLRNIEALSKLTRQQTTVLSMIAQGLTNQEIASRRNTTIQSTEQLITRIYRTLELERSSAVSMRVSATMLYANIAGAPSRS